MNKYIDKLKKKPEKLLFDVLNTAIVITFIGLAIVFFLWIASVFKGDILVEPKALAVGSFPIYWYGITFATAFLAGFLLILKQVRDRKMNLDNTVNLLFWTTIFGLIGARIGFALLNLDYYGKNFLQVFNIWGGGLSLYGAIAGGAIFLALYSLIKKNDAWKRLDIFAPALLLGQVIGRWGNFFNQEILGYPTGSALGMYVSPQNRPWEYRGSVFFHPVFLYESLLCLLALIALLIVRSKVKLKDGSVFLIYLVLYSFIRFFIEFIRIEEKIFLSLTIGQLVSLGVFVASIIVIILINKKRFKKKSRR